MSTAFLRTILIISVCSLYSCKELYYPEIDPPPGVLSVEGLITDQPGPYYVRLSRSSVFFSDSVPGPVNDANVYVTDSNGDVHMFTRVRPGTYRSPSWLRGEVGNTYTLHVQTPDGEEYRSYPQTIHPPYEIESLLADSSYQTMTRESNTGRVIVEEVKGVDATLVLSENRKNRANIRFKSSVKVLYTYEGGSFLAPERFFCWKEISGFEGMDNINLPAVGNMPGDVNKNVVAFMPFDKQKYRLGLFDVLRTLLVKVTLYSIGDDSYNYYLNINKQLTSDETIFAPVPSQIDGNMYCVSDEDKVVTGLFEASSVTSGAFILRLPPHQNKIFFEPTDGYDDIPQAGCYSNEHPPFWIN